MACTYARSFIHHTHACHGSTGAASCADVRSAPTNPRFPFWIRWPSVLSSTTKLSGPRLAWLPLQPYVHRTVQHAQQVPGPCMQLLIRPSPSSQVGQSRHALAPLRADQEQIIITYLVADTPCRARTAWPSTMTQNMTGFPSLPPAVRPCHTGLRMHGGHIRSPCRP